MNKEKDTSKKRHIAKTITWRVVGTLDTMILSWIISGDPLVALQIGGAEVITKMILYYLHERLWYKASLGESLGLESHKRHVLKTVSWRVVGTIDTMILAWIISGSPLIGFKIGIVEVITKMILYYLHERAWYRSNYGLTARKNDLKKKPYNE